MKRKKIIAVLTALMLIFISSMNFSFAEGSKGGAEKSAGGSNVITSEEKDQQNDQNSGQDQNDGTEEENVGKDDSDDQKNEDKTEQESQTEKGQTDQDNKNATDDEEKKEESNGEKKNKDKDDTKKQIEKAVKEGRLDKKDKKTVIEYESQIEQIDKTMEQIEDKLKKLGKMIAKIEKKEKSQKKKLGKLQKEMEQRLRTMYKNGDAGFADVVLNSDNIGDMVSNAEMVERIYESDQNGIRELKEKYKSIEKEEKKLKKAKKEQKEVLAQQLKMMDTQNDTILASAALYKNLNGKYKGGALLWPCPSSHSISSKFGWRNCPFHGREIHRGIDIPTYTGAPILAAYAGTVIRSGYSGGYGNFVAIAHGGGLVTLYAHNSKLVVRAGQTVKQGQVIAKAGCTGPATGTHCHFEVQLNGKLVNPMKML